MPFVHVELIEGRTEEQLTNMVKDITEAVSKNAGAPKENIHVIVNELKKDRYAPVSYTHLTLPTKIV